MGLYWGLSLEETTQAAILQISLEVLLGATLEDFLEV